MEIVQCRWWSEPLKCWINDYLGSENGINCILSSSDKDSKKFSYLLSKSRAGDIHLILSEVLSQVLREPKDSFRIIQLGMNSNEDFVTGKFEIMEISL